MKISKYNFPWIIIGFLFSLYAYSVISGADRFSVTPFRESQTAITAYYMASGESPFLAYELPVLGAPWSVPLEFPIFQWTAAAIGGSDIETLRWTGRLLSLGFWLGCLWMVWLIAKRSPIGQQERIWLVVLLAAAPVFVAYSTTFLIETFTLFFALGYMWAYLRLRQSGDLLNLSLALAFGILAVLSKATTWAPFAGVLVLGTCADLFIGSRYRIELRKLLKLVLLPAIAVIIPLVIGLAWVKFGDFIKLQNPLASNLTSENLSRWNYGSIEQKLSPVVWAVILVKQGLMLFGPAMVLVPVLLVKVVWDLLKQRQLTALHMWAGIGIAGYTSAPIVFTNLHFRHDYYLVANGFFLIAATICLLSILRGSLSTKVMLWTYRVVVISALFSAFGYTALRKSLTEPQEDALVAKLQTLQGEGGVVFFGFDWGAQMPYELERRALMLKMTDPADPLFLDAMRANKDQPWIAMAIADDRFAEIADAARKELGLELAYENEVWPGVCAWTHVPIAEAGSGTDEDLLESIAAKLAGVESPESGVVFLHSWLTPKATGEGPVEVMFRRRSDLFYLSLGEMRLYRLRNYFP